MFRAIQALSVTSLLIMWLVRSHGHPAAHPMLLAMAILLGLATEASYRAGIAAVGKQDAKTERPT